MPQRFQWQWILVAAVGAIFLPWWGITAAREHSARLAIELHTPFLKPFLDVRFSKKIQYDPQTFIGRGRETGYWIWSPEGLELGSKGRQFFADTGDGESIAGAITAGKRQLDSVNSVQDRNGGREVLFNYSWTEISEPIAKLLNAPPKKGVAYRGKAMLVEENSVWKVQSMSLPDFDEPMAILQKQAAGALR